MPRWHGESRRTKAVRNPEEMGRFRTFFVHADAKTTKPKNCGTRDTYQGEPAGSDAAFKQQTEQRLDRADGCG